MIEINNEKCIGCGQCVRDCFPVDIDLIDGKAVPRNEKCFDCGHCMAVCPTDAVTLLNYDSAEVLDLKQIHTAIDPETYLNHLKARRSIRRFTDQPVTKEQVEQILEAGRFSPTGGNRQRMAYTVIQDSIPEMRGLLIDQLGRKGEEMLAAGHRASFYTDLWLDMHKDYHSSGKDRIFFGAGTVIVISSDDTLDAGIAAAHMETMIYSMGLGMLYSGFSRFAIESSEELRARLKIREKYHVEAVLVIGYPAVHYQRTVPRKPADVVWE